MKSQVRSIRERLAHVEFESSKQAIKVADLEDSIKERKDQKENCVANNQTWLPESQFYVEDMEIQLEVERLIQSKLQHHIKFLHEELERNK